jgi:hypothetical protein
MFYWFYKEKCTTTSKQSFHL